MKKFLSVILVLIVFCSGSAVSVYAEDVNPFPPQRPGVGVMDFDSCILGTSAAVRTNGTVNVLSGSYTDYLCSRFSNITDAVGVACIGDGVIVLRSDGTICADAVVYNTATYVKPERINLIAEVNTWENIVSVCAGAGHIVGLKADGTVVAACMPHYDKGQCNVQGWNNVSYIYADRNYTIGVRKDGSVLIAGEIHSVNNLRKEKDVKKVSMNYDEGFNTYYDYITVKTDGTLGGYNTNREALSLDKIEKILKDNNVGKIIDAEVYDCYLYILDENGKLYQMYTHEREDISENFPKLLEENVYSFADFSIGTYYAIDNNGMILSNKMGFTSDDWILTTNITYNGTKVNSDVPPYIKDGRTLAPMRAILEALGMTVSWDGATQTATAVKADINISISINSNIAIVNGKQQTLDVPAEITNGRTFVPVRFFAEALNMNVGWDAYTKTVNINSK